MKKAQSLVEYALILSLVVVVSLVAFKLLGQEINKTLGKVNTAISSTTPKLNDCKK